MWKSTLALLCALLIGFAAHRASLCNVRAMAEIMTSGSAHMLGSLIQAALWTATLSGVLVFGVGVTPVPVFVPTLVGWALLGGWLFGIGAAVNGGCSLSTLHRLVDGEWSMLATLAGFALGVASWASARHLVAPMTLVPAAPVWTRWPGSAAWLLPVLLLWAISRVWAFRRMLRERPGAPLTLMLVAPTYHLSVSAAIMGLAAGALFALEGAWSYTNHLRTSVLHGVVGSIAPSHWHSTMVVALIAGMLGSALQRGSIAIRRSSAMRHLTRHLAGGALMGLGASLVPGGNDTLLLNHLPTLTLQATATYLAMLAGIAGALLLMTRARMSMTSVACTPEGCKDADTSSAQSATEDPIHGAHSK